MLWKKVLSGCLTTILVLYSINPMNISKAAEPKEEFRTEDEEMLLKEKTQDGRGMDEGTEGIYDGYMYYRIQENEETGRQEAVITGVREDEKVGRDYIISAIIPDAIEGVPVTGIGNGAFRGCKNLSDLKFPSNLEKLYSNAFHSCESLQRVEIPRDIQVIDFHNGNPAYRGPFAGCKSLRSVKFEEGTTRIGPGLLQGCTGLQKIDIPHTVTEIANNAFEGCSGLTEVTLPEDLKTIGNRAFLNCTGLERTALPEGLEHLECGAFQGCTSLSEINIPLHVQMGEYVGENYQYPGPFSGCSSLRTVTFAKQTTSIWKGLFFGCSGLMKIELPDTVTEIQGSAFKSCSNLAEIKLPKGLKSIEGGAFAYCESLTEAELPEGLEFLASGAFTDCTALESVRIPADMKTSQYAGANRAWTGPFPGCSSLNDVTFGKGTVSIEKALFWLCPGLQNIRIPEGITAIGYRTFNTSSLTGIYFEGAAPSMNDSIPNSSNVTGYVLEKNWDSFEDLRRTYNQVQWVKWDGSLKIDIPKGKYALIVRNEEGHGIEGASVQYGTETYTSGKDGAALLPLDRSNHMERLEVSAEGYIPRVTTLEQNLTARQSIVVLSSDASKVNSAILDAGDQCRDVLTTEYRIDVSETTEYRLEVKLGSPEIQTERFALVLSGSEKELISSSDGEFAFKGTDFQGWLGTLAVLAYGPGGTRISKTALALKTYKAAEPDEPYFEISGDTINFRLSKDAPIMAGKEFHISLANLPVEFYKSDSKVRIGINVDGRTVREDGKWCGLKDMLRSNTTQKWKEKYDEFVKKEDGKQKNPEISVLGYGESDSAAGKCTVNLAVKVTWKLSSGEQQAWIFVYKVTGKLGGEAAASFGIQWDQQSLKPYWSGLVIKPRGSVEVSGGIGAAKVLSVGAYGNAGIEAAFNLFSKKLPLVSSLKVDGEAGLYGRLLWGEAKVKLWSGETYLYYNNGKKGRTAPVSRAVQDLYDTGRYEDSPRTYLTETSPWKGSAGARTRRSQKKNLLELQSNVYTDIRPVLAGTKEGTMLLYTADGGTGRKDRDRTMLVYSLYDAGTRKFSQPKPILDDGTADFSPSVWSDDERIYVVWQNAAGIIAEEETLESAAANMELYMGIYENDAWSVQKVAQTDENGTFENMPRIYGENDAVYVAWVENKKDPVFGTEGINEICLARLKGGHWTVEKRTETADMVLSMDLGKWSGNEGCIALVTDQDQDAVTTSDSKLTLYSEEGSVREEEGVYQASFGEIGGKTDLIVVKDECLYLLGQQDGTMQPVTPEDFAVPQNARLIKGTAGIEGIIWTAAGDNKAALYGKFCDGGGTWGETVTLAEGEEHEYLENAAVASKEGQNILVCTRRYLDWGNLLSGGDGKEKNDLCWMPLEGYTDLKVTYAEVDQSDIAPGSVQNMDIRVENQGTKQADAFRLHVQDQEGNSYYDQRIDQGILPGGSQKIRITIPVWEEEAEKTLLVTAGEAEESYEESNGVKVAVGQPNLEVYASKFLTEGRYTLGITVTNTGLSPAAGTVYIADNETKQIYKTIETGELGFQQSEVRLLEMKDLGFGSDENTELHIYAESGKEQIGASNDDYAVLLAEEKKDLSDMGEETITLSQDTYTYDGSEKKPKVHIPGLSEGTDYRVSYLNNRNAGTAAALVEGIHSYGGRLLKEFVIERAQTVMTGTKQYVKYLASAPFAIEVQTNSDGNLIYSSDHASVASVDENGIVTVNGAGTAMITVAAEETGNCTYQEMQVQVTVSEKRPDKNLSDCNIELEKRNYVYSAKANMPSVSITDGNTVLKNGVHYTVAYKNNVNAGRAAAVVTAREGSGYTGFKEIIFTISKAKQNFILTREAKKGYVKKSGASSFSVGVRVDSGRPLSYQTNNGKVAAVSASGKVSVRGVGEAVITIRAAETVNYDGNAAKIAVKVNPKGTRIAGLKKRSSNKLLVKWAKTANVSGYQLQYAVKKNFTGKKTITIKSAGTKKKTLSKLKNTKYYIRIRTFKKVKGKTYYSNWSKTKSKKV